MNWEIGIDVYTLLCDPMDCSLPGSSAVGVKTMSLPQPLTAINLLTNYTLLQSHYRFRQIAVYPSFLPKKLSTLQWSWPAWP